MLAKTVVDEVVNKVEETSNNVEEVAGKVVGGLVNSVVKKENNQ